MRFILVTVVKVGNQKLRLDCSTTATHDRGHQETDHKRDHNGGNQTYRIIKTSF